MQASALRARVDGAEEGNARLAEALQREKAEAAALRQLLAAKVIDVHGVEEAARRMETELHGHGLLPAGQSILDGTAPAYYLEPAAPVFNYSCLERPRQIPLPVALNRALHW